MSVNRRSLGVGFLALAMGTAPAWAQCTRVVFSANPDYPPYHWAEGDRIVGASVALTGRILDELGVAWQARFVGPWPRVLKSAEFGEIDLVVSLKPTPEREAYLEFTRNPSFPNPMAVFVARARPLRFLGLVPQKLAHTFEYCGAAGWYLRASGPSSFSERAKLGLGVVETVFQRLLVLLALVGVARAPGPLPRVRRLLAIAAGALLLSPMAWLSYVGLTLAAALAGRGLAQRPALALGASAVGTALLTHAVFFGAGRYSLVVFPLVAAMAGTALAGRRGAGESPAF